MASDSTSINFSSFPDGDGFIRPRLRDVKLHTPRGYTARASLFTAVETAPSPHSIGQHFDRDRRTIRMHLGGALAWALEPSVGRLDAAAFLLNMAEAVRSPFDENESYARSQAVMFAAAVLMPVTSAIKEGAALFDAGNGGRSSQTTTSEFFDRLVKKVVQTTAALELSEAYVDSLFDDSASLSLEDAELQLAIAELTPVLQGALTELSNLSFDQSQAHGAGGGGFLDR